MKSIKKLFLVCALSFCASSWASAQLPPEVQADLLQEQIVDGLKAKDYRTVKDKIFEYKNLGVTVPPAILLINAKIAIQEEDFQEAQSSLEDYFNAGGKEHKSYQEALNLYKSDQPKAQAERDRLASIARDQQSRRDAEAKRLADIEEDKQAILDRGRKIFLDAFSDLEDLVEGYEPSRKDEKTFLRVSQSLYGADVMDCDFKYSRNVSKSSKGNGNIPSEKSGSNINVSSLLGRAIQSKQFNYTNSYVVKGSLPDGRGNWVDTSYRQKDKVYIDPTMLGEIMLSSSGTASSAKKYLEKMQQGCDIFSGKAKQSNLVSRSATNLLKSPNTPVTNKQAIMSNEVKYVANEYNRYSPADEEVKSAFTHAKFDYDQKNYEVAARLFRPLAEKGHVKAQILLARLYAQGKGVEKSSEQALSWYQAAADINSVEAQWRLGKHYLEGDIFSQSYSEAFKWFSKAAENKVVFSIHSGKSNAMYELGSLYDKGNGVPQSYEKAAHWYQLAGRSAKFSYIHYRLGQMFENGEGVEISLSKALEFYEESLSMGPMLGPEGQASVFRVQAKISGEDPEKLKAATNTCQKEMDCLEFSPSFKGIKIKNLCNMFVGVNVKTFPKQGNPKDLSGGIPPYFSINYENEFGDAQLSKYSVGVRNYKPDRCTLEKDVFPR